MTREEAIKSALKYLVRKQQEQGSWGYADNDDTHEVSWDEIIKWVDQRSCGDLISRQDVMIVLCDCAVKSNMKGRVALLHARNMIHELPSVKPETRWIPVSERLPKDRESVLLSTNTNEVFEGSYFDDDSDRQWYSCRDETFIYNNVVTAWMPLSEPYKAESEEENESM